MENSIIELHDSKIADISSKGDTVIVRFLPAYIHKSMGRPGIDSGTGWIQVAELLIFNGTVTGNYPELPCDVVDGDLVLDGKQHDNMIPIPCETSQAVRLRLSFDSVHTAVVTGEGVKLQLRGKPTFVEDFKGESHS